MIGVVFERWEGRAVEEFFQLFKTPWEPFRSGAEYDVVLVASGAVPETAAGLIVVFGSQSSGFDQDRQIPIRGRQRNATLRRASGENLPVYGDVLLFGDEAGGAPILRGDSGVAGVRIETPSGILLRIGYDLFKEVEFLVSEGQPAENAQFPTLDLHIQMLREWMLDAGVGFVEIPPHPSGYKFAVCLTHDIDFIGVRRHKFDHTLFGFLLRATVGSLVDFFAGRQTFSKLLANWRAAATLPFVYAGWAKDFWFGFPDYLEIERGLGATYYFIPFRGRRGDRVPARNPDRRAAPYDVRQHAQLIKKLADDGCEIGVHGIDAWNSAEKGREELERISTVAGARAAGIRMHWLLHDRDSMAALERAGYEYDSTLGYNETIGYRSGTSQAFRPLEVERLLELPMQIQDGALFYRQRLGLSNDAARALCQPLLDHALKSGGVLTTIWHDRSLGPERFWGEFYAAFVTELRSMNAWFANGRDVIGWFRKRREVTFQGLGSAHSENRVRISSPSLETFPPMLLRIYRPAEGAAGEPSEASRSFSVSETVWKGGTIDLSTARGAAILPASQAAAG